MSAMARSASPLEIELYVIILNFTFVFRFSTVKPLITNTSEEFIKCRLDSFSKSFIQLGKFQYLRK